MRNRELHDALRAFAIDAAAFLREEMQAGAELEFDLDEGERRGGPVLYHYRPLTGKFISERWTSLSRLPTCAPASKALGSGAAAYLRVNGLRGGSAEPALRAMLENLYEDVTDFAFPEDRFERSYEEVERTLYEQSRPATVLVPVHGLELEAERVELGDGLELARGEYTDAPDEAVWGKPFEADDDRPRPNTLLTLTRDVKPDDPLPVTEARARFGKLLTGLRLWKPGGIALSALAWRRTGEGVWAPFELESTGTARGEPWILVDGEEAELKEFLAVIGRATAPGAVGWALRRFELGCGRARDGDAIPDYLLALSALLDSRSEGGAARLGMRVAALCAEGRERKGVQRRVELAQALDSYDIVARRGDDYVDVIGSESPRTLVDEIERHLRALLRDVLCGFLAPDLGSLADELLLESSPEPAPSPVPASEPEPEPVEEDVTTEIEALEAAGVHFDVTAREPADQAELEYDWDDEDSYSAPV